MDEGIHFIVFLSKYLCMVCVGSNALDTKEQYVLE